MRVGDLKIVVLDAQSKDKEKVEMYNLAKDFGETKNLVTSNPRRTRMMYDKMN